MRKRNLYHPLVYPSATRWDQANLKSVTVMVRNKQECGKTNRQNSGMQPKGWEASTYQWQKLKELSAGSLISCAMLCCDPTLDAKISPNQFTSILPAAWLAKVTQLTLPQWLLLLCHHYIGLSEKTLSPLPTDSNILFPMKVVILGGTPYLFPDQPILPWWFLSYHILFFLLCHHYIYNTYMICMDQMR